MKRSLSYRLTPFCLWQVEITCLDHSITIFPVRIEWSLPGHAFERFRSFYESQREKLGPQIWREIDHLALEVLSTEYTCRPGESYLES